MTANRAVELLQRNLRLHPGKNAYRCRERTLTFGELHRAAHGFASLLQRGGIDPGERVAILLPDSLAFPVAFLGCLLRGAVAVVIPAATSDEELSFIIGEYGARLLVTRHGPAPPAPTESDGIETIFCDDDRLPGEGACYGISPPPFDSRDEDIAYILFTSGSTGRPKGVLHRRKSLSLPCELVGRDILGISSDDVILSTSKLSFSYGLINSLSFPLFFGATAILCSERPEPDPIWKIIERERPTVFFSVPGLYARMILSRAEERLCVPMRLCCSAGEALPAPLFHEWQRYTGLEIVDGYGLTESSYHVICNIPGASVPGAAGRLVPGYRARLVDEEGNDVPAGSEGRLLLGGDTISPSALAQGNSPSRGFLVTSDIFVEKDGLYYHRGRSDDMIKSDALWVSPQVVEEALRRHPAVAECAVAAVSVGVLTRPGAFVVPRGGIDNTLRLAEELREHMRSILPEHMRPARYRFVRELPRTATGKLQRFRLREEIRG